MNNISSNKASTCFAINGSWGCGKSFVLDMFEEQLNVIQSEETYTDKYFVIRYNSWKYDYYEEPLVAIVATMISVIEEKTKLFPDSQEKREILGMLKATGVALLSMASTAVKENTGLDLQTAFETVRKGEKEGAAAYESEHGYDVYFGFNKMIEKLAGLLRDLAKNYTVVILVDELDRCLPEYAIKVLERLHHLTEGTANIITVIAIDKEQLMSSVKQIFGFERPEKYLEKFFNFEVKLDCGTVSEKISEKYAEYFALFDKAQFPTDDSVEECLQALLMGIDIRSQEQLVNRTMLAHKLLYSDKKDYSFMCMEILLAVMIYVYDYSAKFSDVSVKLSSFEKVFIPYGNSPTPRFAAFFKEKFESMPYRTHRAFRDDPMVYALSNHPSLYGAILFTWYWMHKRSTGYVVQHSSGDVYEAIAKNHEHLLKFAETIKMMQ
jgi:hypothetical protein